MGKAELFINTEDGFSLVEIIVGVVVFGIMLSGLFGAYTSIRHSYATARQLNEMYTVLSACPEVDRALEFNSLSDSTNCYPNNTFQVENTTAAQTITYSPTINVTDTADLSSGDPLKTVPDSKIVEISLPFQKPNQSYTPLKLRLLITRNGIGQL